MPGSRSFDNHFAVFGYYRKPGADWAAFLAQQEGLVLKMMGRNRSSGTSPPRKLSSSGYCVFSHPACRALSMRRYRLGVN
jgi:hypothetical protein